MIKCHEPPLVSFPNLNIVKLQVKTIRTCLIQPLQVERGVYEKIILRSSIHQLLINVVAVVAKYGLYQKFELQSIQ